MLDHGITVENIIGWRIVWWTVDGCNHGNGDVKNSDKIYDVHAGMKEVHWDTDIHTVAEVVFCTSLICNLIIDSLPISRINKQQNLNKSAQLQHIQIIWMLNSLNETDRKS